MGTVSTAALDKGGRVISVIPSIFSDDVINSQPRSETVLVSSKQERKSHILSISDGFVALPGGVGTLDEISEVLMSNQLGLCCKPMGLLNIDGYFNPLIQQVQRMIEEDLLCPGADYTLLVDDTPEELLRKLDEFRPNQETEFLASIRRQ